MEGVCKRSCFNPFLFVCWVFVHMEAFGGWAREMGCSGRGEGDV
jgi:hypothetical protein